MPMQVSPDATLLHTARVLVVAEDMAAVREAYRGLKDWQRFHVHGARDPGGAIEDLFEHHFDVLVVDHRCWCGSTESGPDLQDAVAESRTAAVVIVGPGCGEADCTSADLTSTYVVTHGSLYDSGGLGNTVREAFAMAMAMRRRETMTRWLAREATTDMLTGLHNRSSFDLALDAACAESAEERTGLILMNVVGTDAVNQNYGRAAGDQLLQRAAIAITRVLRSEDVAARLAGDTFGVVLRGADINTCRRVARRIAQELEHANEQEWPGEVPVTLTFGAASGLGYSSRELYEQARRQLTEQRRRAPAFASSHGSSSSNGPSIA